LPFEAGKTLASAGAFFPTSSVHPVHQLQFATTVKNLFTAAIDYGDRDTLLQEILRLRVFSIYGPRGIFSDSAAFAWLDNAEARNTLKATFAIYLAKSPSTTDESNLFAQVQEIVNRLDALHPEHDNLLQSMFKKHLCVVIPQFQQDSSESRNIQLEPDQQPGKSCK
jgi:hypothetical protein